MAWWGLAMPSPSSRHLLLFLLLQQEKVRLTASCLGQGPGSVPSTCAPGVALQPHSPCLPTPALGPRLWVLQPPGGSMGPADLLTL